MSVNMYIEDWNTHLYNIQHQRQSTEIIPISLAHTDIFPEVFSSLMQAFFYDHLLESTEHMHYILDDRNCYKS